MFDMFGRGVQNVMMIIGTLANIGTRNPSEHSSRCVALKTAPVEDEITAKLFEAKRAGRNRVAGSQPQPKEASDG